MINKINISTRKSYLSEGNLSPSWGNTAGNILLETMADSRVWFAMLTTNIYSNPIPHMVVPFLLVYMNWQENVKRRRGRGYIQQLRNIKHKGKTKIRCYSKYLLIFTAYQVQGWWTMSLSPIKAQPDGRNFREILLKRSWSTTLVLGRQWILEDIWGSIQFYVFLCAWNFLIYLDLDYIGEPI